MSRRIASLNVVGIICEKLLEATISFILLTINLQHKTKLCLKHETPVPWDNDYKVPSMDMLHRGVGAPPGRRDFQGEITPLRGGPREEGNGGGERRLKHISGRWCTSEHVMFYRYFFLCIDENEDDSSHLTAECEIRFWILSCTDGLILYCLLFVDIRI